MQGMSGSPVYIDGRLIGAVSYSLGAFSKEPIAGITPIADMIDATDRTTGTPAPVRSVAADLPWPAPPAQFAAALRDAFARITSASAPIALAGVDAPVLAALPDHSQLRPIAVAYTMAGFSGDTAAAFTRALGAPVAAAGRGPGAGRGRHRRHGGAGARRRGRRQPDPRRPDLRRHRHGHPRRRRPRLRVRPSVLQPRPDRLPDDARPRADAAAEPERLAEAGRHRRRRRHDAPGSLDGDRRHARRRSGAGPGEAHAAVRSRAGADLHLRDRARTSCSRRS